MASSNDPQRETLIASLRQRYAQAERDDDAETRRSIWASNPSSSQKRTDVGV
jgi:hypothetical protein